MTPALLGIATFAATGFLIGFAIKDPRCVHIRPALGGMAILMLCGPLTIFYSALRLPLIEAETFDGLIVTVAVSAPFVVFCSYFTIRKQLKGKKELV